MKTQFNTIQKQCWTRVIDSKISLRLLSCQCFAKALLWLDEIVLNNFWNIDSSLVRLDVICILGDLIWLSLCLGLDLLAVLYLRFLTSCFSLVLYQYLVLQCLSLLSHLLEYQQFSLFDSFHICLVLLVNLVRFQSFSENIVCLFSVVGHQYSNLLVQPWLFSTYLSKCGQ
ncbi:Hypothetical_protein [Hexamita inflata]|uniref:Hypothetical_protein n=1 Tax=Hexamita inflata TaxID=28002 RepID=A0AA86TPJ6_9EUKA|nr:Hypothetical protein HINF_LOCUS6453 [Hexamita inflata]